LSPLLRRSSNRSPDLSGKTALVTGATGGVGRAIARELRANGAGLLVSGRRAEALEALEEELRARPIACDLTRADEVELLAERARHAEIAVVNAGLPGTGPVDAFSHEELDRVLDVNLRAAVLLARGVVRPMIERGSGHIVFIGSLSGQVATHGNILYAATKFGLHGFARGLREELHGTGVLVSMVIPGFISGAGMYADSGVELPKGVGTKRPEDVAKAVVRTLHGNRRELYVATPALRLATRLGVAFPGLVGPISRRFDSGEMAAAMSVAQRPKLQA
jgi:uncharacterized protein